MIGGILEAAHIEGFMLDLKERALKTDNRAVAEREFIEEWWTHHKYREVTARDLLPLALPFDRFYLLRYAVPDDEELTEKSRPKPLGAVLVRAPTACSPGVRSWRRSLLADTRVIGWSPSFRENWPENGARMDAF